MAEIFTFLENWSRLESTQMYRENFFFGGALFISGPRKKIGPIGVGLNIYYKFYRELLHIMKS